MLLQVLDDGRLTDGQGRTVDFRNAVLIMTSNIRSAEAMREHFRPEFLNRIDEIVEFKALSREQLGEIVELQLDAAARAARRARARARADRRREGGARRRGLGPGLRRAAAQARDPAAAREPARAAAARRRLRATATRSASTRRTATSSSRASRSASRRRSSEEASGRDPGAGFGVAEPGYGAPRRWSHRAVGRTATAGVRHAHKTLSECVANLARDEPAAARAPLSDDSSRSLAATRFGSAESVAALGARRQLDVVEEVGAFLDRRGAVDEDDELLVGLVPHLQRASSARPRRRRRGRGRRAPDRRRAASSACPR